MHSLRKYWKKMKYKKYMMPSVKTANETERMDQYNLYFSMSAIRSISVFSYWRCRRGINMVIRITALVVYLKHCNIRSVTFSPTFCSHWLTKRIKQLKNKIKIYDMDYPSKKKKKWKFSIHSIENVKGTNFCVYEIMQIPSHS